MATRLLSMCMGIIVLGVLGGCAGPTVVTTGVGPDVRGKATITEAMPRYITLFETTMAEIQEVDGVPHSTEMRWANVFEVSPGPHVVKVVLRTVVYLSMTPRVTKAHYAVFEVEAGRNYIVEGERTASDWRFWIKEKESGRIVAEAPSPDQPILSVDPEPVVCKEYLSAIERATSAGEGTAAYVKKTLGWREFVYMSRRVRKENGGCDLLMGQSVDKFLQQVFDYCLQHQGDTFGMAVNALGSKACP